MAQQEHSLLNNYMLYQRSTPFFPRDKYMRFGYDFLNIHFHLLPLRKNFIKFFLNGINKNEYLKDYNQNIYLSVGKKGVDLCNLRNKSDNVQFT